MGFERSMDLTAEKKNDGGLTKYGFGFNKKIKGFGAEKSRVFQQSMDLNCIEK